MKKLFLISIVGLFVLAGCDKESDESVTRTEILEGETINMRVGETLQLHIKVYPEDLKNETQGRAYAFREWRSSNEKVVFVGAFGEVKAITAGESVVTAITPDNVSVACKIVVREIAITEITIKNTNDTILIGDQLQLNPMVMPDSASYKDKLVYLSSNEAIATVGNNGVVQGISEGKCKIEIASADGKVSAVCNLVVNPIRVADVILKLSDDQGISIKKGGKHTIEISIVPSNATNTNLTWTTSDAAIATVANGVVTGVAAGTAIITVKSDDNSEISKSFTVTVE